MRKAVNMDLPREIALNILYDINERGAYSNIALNRHFNENDYLRDIDRSFITELVYGVVKWKLTIDWVIGQFSSLKYKKISPWIMNILRLGVYQLLYMEKVPEQAACNESVNLSKRYGHKASSRYVNAVLRNISRNKNDIKYPGRDENILHFLSIRYSHPEWLVIKWMELLGIKLTEELLNANNDVPCLSIRVNTLRITRDELMDSLKKSGMGIKEGRYMEEALQIDNVSSISKIEDFKKGYFQVQDESSMMVSRILDPRPGELVIDVCSAPGGKTAHMAQLMENKGMIVARDIHEHKIMLVEDTMKRMGINIVKTEVFDAVDFDEKYLEKADRVLVDAPCTGLGIIRRKPDIKWRRNVSDEKEITSLQLRILNTASKYVKPGGVLVYSTCTINPDENEGIVSKFIGLNKEFRMVDITPYLHKSLKKPDASKGRMQLYPNIDKTDGFFIAKMEKVGNDAT